MRDLNKMFGIPLLTPKEAEEIRQQELIMKEIVTIFSNLAIEFRAAKNFTCADIAEILQNLNMPGHRDTPLGQFIELLGGAFEYVQKGDDTTSAIQETLRHLSAASTTKLLERKVLEQMLKEPEIYNWIKPRSV